MNFFITSGPGYLFSSKLTFLKSSYKIDQQATLTGNVFIHQFPASFQNYEGFENEYNARVSSTVYMGVFK